MVEAACGPACIRGSAGVCWFGGGDVEWQQGAAFVSPVGNACAVDGRIDGRYAEDNETYVVDLYDRHGIEGLRGLTGDWSAVIWDARRRSVILASDYAGTRPLYYSAAADSVAWATSLRPLARFTGHRRLNSDYAARFLCSGLPAGVTPYEGIFSVPPGHAVILTRDGTRMEALWRPPLETSIRYGAETGYEEHFRALFEEAVAVRLQTPGLVAAELSGGLDSSSIVCMADRLISRGDVPATGLITFSYDTPGSPDAPFMAEVEKACCTVRPHHIDAADFPVMTPRNSSAARPTFAEQRLFELRRHMEAAGASELLTGQFGDLITGNVPDDSEQAADHFRAWRFGAGFRELLAWSRSTRTPAYSLLRRSLRAAYRPTAEPWENLAAPNDSLPPSVRARGRELAAASAHDRLLASAEPSRRKRLVAARGMFAGRFFQCPEPLEGMLYSHPFTHRPLVEFMLAIPPALICRPGEPRRLMRRALRGLLPDSIQRRRSKGNYQSMFLKAMRSCAAEMAREPESMVLATMGFVDAMGVGLRLSRLNQGLPCNEPQLRQIILLELWLRSRIGEGDIADGSFE